MKKLNLLLFSIPLLSFILLSCSKEDEVPAPVADFSVSKTSALVDEEIQFNNLSENAKDYLWDFGDGNVSLEKSPMHWYTNSGTYKVTLTVTSAGKLNSKSIKVDIAHPSPVAGFTMDKAEAKVNETITFTNVTVNASSYAWDFGDGNTSNEENPKHTYLSAGNFTVSLVATGDGGEQTVSKTIDITHLAPVASFTIDNTSALLEEVITFTNTSENTTSYLWDFGDGRTSTEENPKHSFSIGGTFTVSLTATGDGGEDTLTKTVEIIVDDANIFPGFGTPYAALAETWAKFKKTLPYSNYEQRAITSSSGTIYTEIYLINESVVIYFQSESGSEIVNDNDVVTQIHLLSNFNGNTQKGIKMGSPLSDVEIVYGTPDYHDNESYDYNSGIVFYYDESMVVDYMIIFPASSGSSQSTTKRTGKKHEILRMNPLR
ncbi:MAG: hypothetical protein COC06_10425 [Bacteroidales bacterium]|nr:MAG: hypothetical protein COC06_10425 [Bacteroidales bacterium]